MAGAASERSCWAARPTRSSLIPGRRSWCAAEPFPLELDHHPPGEGVAGLALDAEPEPPAKIEHRLVVRVHPAHHRGKAALARDRDEAAHHRFAQALALPSV